MKSTYGIFRVYGWLCSTPDLSGRWEGTLCRHGEKNKHKFVIEITQNFTKLKYYVYTKNGRGESISTKFIKDEVEGKYKLVSAWRSKTKSILNPNDYDEFDGMSIMSISEFDGTKRMEDIYFTNRTPRTSGCSKLRLVSKN